MFSDNPDHPNAQDVARFAKEEEEEEDRLRRQLEADLMEVEDGVDNLQEDIQVDEETSDEEGGRDEIGEDDEMIDAMEEEETDEEDDTDGEDEDGNPEKQEGDEDMDEEEDEEGELDLLEREDIEEEPAQDPIASYRNPLRTIRLHPLFFDHSRTQTRCRQTLTTFLRHSPTNKAGFTAIKPRLEEFLTKPPVQEIRVTCVQTNIYKISGVSCRADKSVSKHLLTSRGEGIRVIDVVKFFVRNRGKGNGFLSIETDLGDETFIEIPDAIERE